MRRVGIRALQQNASAVVARAAAGEIVEITDRGRPVARLVPLGDGELASLVASAGRPAGAPSGQGPAAGSAGSSRCALPRRAPARGAGRRALSVAWSVRVEALRSARRHSPPALAATRDRLDTVALLRVTSAAYDLAAELDPAVLRTLDALHLAVALAIGDELEGVATYDDRLASAATLHGVAVAKPT